MFVGNTCYVTHHYVEKTFRMFFELQLKESSEKLSPAFVEQSIAAFLDCKEMQIDSPSLNVMDNLLKELDISYEDYRSFEETQTEGDPLDAVKAFNWLASRSLSTKQA